MSDLNSDQQEKKHSLGGAVRVALGIFLSRIFGLVRMRVLAHFLGDSAAGDAFYAAIRIPNFPQNLLGEGVLAASFIPVYSNLVAKGDKEQAGQVAGVILSFLSLIVAIIVLLGVVFTPLFIDLVAPGFYAEKRELTIQLVRIIFPGTGVLVLSAWCLGILNSHHRFFLSYVAPVFSNLAVIGILIFYRNEVDQNKIALYASWGLVLGSLFQLFIQLPTSLKLVPHLKLSLSVKLNTVREVIKNFIPVLISRGVVQVSAFIDGILASFLPSGAVAALGYSQSIYMLPISLFGMSVSAAELPVMSQAYGEVNFYKTLQSRINNSSQKIAFFVIPSVVGFVFLGDVIAGVLFQSGQFDQRTADYVWMVLAGSGFGLLASTLGRLYSSAFYSLRDTKTPLRYSILRVVLTTSLGYLMGLELPGVLNLDAKWGTVGLTISAGFAGWVEFLLLRRHLNQLIGRSGLKLNFLFKVWLSALVSGGCAFAFKFLVLDFHPFFRGCFVLFVFGCIYFPLSAFCGVSESKQIIKKLFRKLNSK